MMSERENLLSLIRRQGCDHIPVEFVLCPSLVEEYQRRTGSALDYLEYFCMPWRGVEDIRLDYDPERYRSWYREPLKAGAKIDLWGVAHEPGSEAAMHMTYMRHPLQGIDELEVVKKYPIPQFQTGSREHQRGQTEAIHQRGLAAVGFMQCTIWETAWYLRGMEDLMMDMMSGDPIAEWILDQVTEQSVLRARAYAQAGVDIVYLGDDVGMQHSVMMSGELYRQWLKPRLEKVIRSIKETSPDTLIFYHSCGFVTPFIGDLLEAGVEVLNPIQSECMNFNEIHQQYGNRLSFHGGLGTQTVMPLGTPDEVKNTVRCLLDTAGEQGGLMIAPTHMLEPETPWENILAYVEACREYKLASPTRA